MQSPTSGPRRSRRTREAPRPKAAQRAARQAHRGSSRIVTHSKLAESQLSASVSCVGQGPTDHHGCATKHALRTRSTRGEDGDSRMNAAASAAVEAEAPPALRQTARAWVARRSSERAPTGNRL